MMLALPFSLLALFLLNPEEPPPSAAEIMSRVAQNQDREQLARNQFVYEQKLHRTLRTKEGKLLREENWTYAMTPNTKGTEKKMLSVKGRYWNNGQYLPFEGLPIPEVGHFDVSIHDGDKNMSRDGIDNDLFPLTTDEQKKYTFELIGEKVVRGRPAYQIRFWPINRRAYSWTGEALIDKEERQPITVYSKLSRRVPVAVRTLLGTDVPGLGFTVQYTRVDKDIWFPATYGTEFEIRALFLLDRIITESMENTNFHRTNVESKIEFKPIDPNP